MNLIVRIEDPILRPIVERGAEAEIKLTHAVADLQDLLLAISRSGVSRRQASDMLRESIRDFQAFLDR